VTLDPLYRVIGWLLALFYIPTHNLGISVILLTIVIMLVQFPLTAKQAKSMIQMQRVQPEIKKIQQKYKDDKQKQNEELLKFYQENKINPLAGCLPMIITIPIGIAVFRTFSHGVQKHLPQTSGKLGTLYHDICGPLNTHACGAYLSKRGSNPPSTLHFLGMSLNLTARQAQGFGGFGQAWPYYVLIALVALTGWYQVKQTQARQLQNSNTPVNAQMQAITKIFPVFFAFICISLNAGAVIYFIVSNIWRIGQQHLVIGKMYDQAIAAGELKAKASGSADAEPAAKDPPGNGKGQPSGAKGSPAKGPAAKSPPPPSSSKGGANGSANGKGQGMSSGARRKKRKR
jgi:YidC/Oxa1 family membrane protein insertase